MGRGRLNRRWRAAKQWMNLEIGRVARWTRFIPEGPRRKARDWLIDRTAHNRSLPAPAPWAPGKYPEGVNLYGFFREENGLAEGVKLYARAMKAAGVPHCLLHTDFLDGFAKDDAEFAGELVRKPVYEVNVTHINPPMWEAAWRCFPRSCFDGRYNIGVWLWELETAPESWKDCLRYVDEIWTPSEFGARAVRAVTDKPVTVIPYGLETPKEDLGRADFGLPEDAFLVLFMFDSNSYASRKNPEAAVDACVEAFGGTGEAHLVLKVNHPKEEDLERLRTKLQDAGIGFTLITERMPRKKLNALTACCDAYLSLHRSEGFGLTIVEAMALGTPVVATDWSANAEFMSPAWCCPVGYTLTPVGDRYASADERWQWADADVHEAAAWLRKLYEDRAFGERIAGNARRHVREEMTPEACGRRIRERIARIHEGKQGETA